MYNRYIPQPDGSHRRRRMDEPKRAVPPPVHPRPHQPPVRPLIRHPVRHRNHQSPHRKNRRYVLYTDKARASAASSGSFCQRSWTRGIF
ncbi:MAG: hypothetical protein J6A74_02155 [Oscillospiraceae bacterium]|nr:hypothetical protein [Oscillospiraceae bacterium]